MPDPAARAGILPAAVAACMAAAAMGYFGKAPLATGGLLLSFAAGFVPYAWVLRSALRPGGAPSFAAVLVVAALMRLLVLGASPSDDVNRYVWEGRVQSEGFNPFISAPADPALEEQRDAVWPGINHPDFPAIYPPGAQRIFRLLAAAGLGPRGFKRIMAGLDLLVVAALGLLLRKRGLPPGRALVYAWSPLATFQIAGRGHMEPLLLLPLILAALVLPVPWAAGTARARSLGGLLAGAAIMAKWTALPLLLVWARRLRFPGFLAAAGVGLLLAVPYLDAGPDLFVSLRRFHAEGHFADSLNALATIALGPGWARLLCAAALLAIGGALAARESDPARGARVILGATLLLSPTVHPWYFLWVLPWLALGRPWGWVALSLTVPLYAEGLVAASGGWEGLEEHDGWKAAAYAAGAAVWAAEWWRHRRRSGAAGAWKAR